MQIMNLSTARRRVAWTIAPIAALALTAAAASPVLSRRLGPDRTAAEPVVNGRSITVVAAGDILVHPPTWEQARKDAGRYGTYDFDPIFSRVRPVIETADLALCHIEAPMGPGAPQDFPRFNAPLQLAESVKNTGFDGCSTASNHSLDQGEAGLSANLSALERHGLKHTGTARTAEEANTPTIYDVQGVKVGHLSYAYGLNPGTAVPAGKPWMANIIGPKRILKAARKLKQAGADIVILSAHWGTEKVHSPNAQQLSLAPKLLASPDIDAIIGHHAHVVQPAEQIDGEWIFYGVGNLLARHDFPTPDNKEGIIPRITFVQRGDGSWTTEIAEAIPIWLGIEPEVRIFNLPHSLAVMSDLDRRRTKYAAAYQRIQGYLGERGALEDGLVVVSPDR